MQGRPSTRERKQAFGKFLIGLYLGASAFSSAYGTAGSVIVVLVWVYYSSQIILLDVEFTKAYVYEFRSPPLPGKYGIKEAEPKV